MKNSQIQNFSFVNHMNKIQIGDSQQIDQQDHTAANNTKSIYSSPYDDAIRVFSSGKEQSFDNTHQLDNINVASFLKDNKKKSNNALNGNRNVENDFQLPHNPLQNKKVFQNILKINSTSDVNALNSKLIREEAISNYNSDISTCKQTDQDQNKICPRHPSKFVKYHLISNSLVQFCSKCALEYAVNGVKIEKNENLREKKLDYDKISIKISQNSKDSSLFTITKNTQPDTQQTQFTETGSQEEAKNESYKNEKLKLFLERVGYTNQFLKQTEQCLSKRLEENLKYFEYEEKKIMETFYEIMQSIENEKNEIMLLSRHSQEQSNNLLNSKLHSIRQYSNEINQFNEDISVNIENIIYQMEKQPFDDIMDRYNVRMSQIHTITTQLQQQQMSLLEINQNFENIKIVKAKIFPNLLTIKQNNVSFKDFIRNSQLSADSLNKPTVDSKSSFSHPQIEIEKCNQLDSSYFIESKPKISSTKNIKQKVMSPYQNSTKNNKVNNFKLLQPNSLNKSYDAAYKHDSSFQLNTSFNLNSSGLNLHNRNMMNNSFSHTTTNGVNNNSRSRSLNCQKPNMIALQEPQIFSYTHQHAKSTNSQPNQSFQKIHCDQIDNTKEKGNLKLKHIQNDSIAKHIQRQNKDKKSSNQSSQNPSRRASRHQYLSSQHESLNENYGKSTNEFIHEEEIIKAQANNTSFDNSFTTNIVPERISINNPSSKLIGHRNSQQNKSINSHINPVFNHSLNNFSNQYNNSIFNKSQNYSQNINNPNSSSVYTSVLKTMKGKLFNQNNHQQSKQNNKHLSSQNNSNNNSHFNSMNTDFNDVNPHNISISNKENLTLNINTMY